MHPKWEFRLRRAETLCGISVVCEAGHTYEFGVGYSNVPANSYTYVWTPPRVWCDSDAPERLSVETLDPLEKRPTFLVYPLYVRRKGVAQWNFFLGCAGLVPRNTQNLYPPQLLLRFSPFRPKWGFFTSKSTKSAWRKLCR